MDRLGVFLALVVLVAESQGCLYQEIAQSALYGQNSKVVDDVSLMECKAVCNGMESKCQSFDYNSNTLSCFLSDKTKDTDPHMFGTHAFMTYFQKLTCDDFEISEEETTTPTVTEASENECKDGWYQNGNSCYYLVKGDDRTWTAANSFCKGMSAHLVSVNSQQEFDFLVDTITEFLDKHGTGVATHELWWTSGRQVGRSSDFIWVDNTNSSLSRYDSMWYPGEPNDYDEDAVNLLHKYGQWGLNDSPPDDRLRHICEYELEAEVVPPVVTVPTPNPLPCPQDWVGFGGHCYLSRHQCAYPWEEAQRDCVSRGGSLASLETVSEREFVYKTLGPEEVYVNYWTGGFRLPNDTWMWTQTDGSDKKISTFDWHANEPNNYEDKEDKISLKYRSKTAKDRWGFNDDSPLKLRSYICEAEPQRVRSNCARDPCQNGGVCKSFAWDDLDQLLSASVALELMAEGEDGTAFRCQCPKGFLGKLCQFKKDESEKWYESQGHLYRFFYDCGMSRDDASETCEMLDSQLASIESSSEMDTVKDFINDYLDADNIDYWWLSGKTVEGRWMWDNGKDTPVNMGWGWADGEPNGWAGDESRVEWRFGDVYGFNDVGKAKKSAFICEKMVEEEKVTEVPDVTTETTDAYIWYSGSGSGSGGGYGSGYGGYDTDDESDSEEQENRETSPTNLPVTLPTIETKEPFECRPGWRQFGLSCYYFEEGSYSWSWANSDCKSKDAHLVTITSKYEIEFLGQTIEELEGGRNNDNTVERDVWHTSGTLDPDREGFHWQDGSGAEIDMRMRIWGMMEPASFPSLRGEEVCLFLSPNSHIWQLMDFMSLSFPYICEYEG